jgi:hypothetical protein
MPAGILVCLRGPNAEATARALEARLRELGRDAGLEEAGGGIAITTNTDAAPDKPRLIADLSPHDTPEFAAEKILDQLAEAGHVRLDTGAYTPEEEAAVQRRLADLGYVE